MRKIALVLLAVALFAIGLLAATATADVGQTTGTGTGTEPCVPSEGSTTTTTVVDVEAYDEEVFDHWQRYSWTGGPHASDDAPAFPSSDWQANVQGDPHGVGVAGAYYRSNGNSGLGDWFYLEAVSGTVHHPAETHDEVVVIEPVTCPEDPGTTTDPECEETLAGQMLGCDPAEPDPDPEDYCTNVPGLQENIHDLPGQPSDWRQRYGICERIPGSDDPCPRGLAVWKGKCYPVDAQKQPDGSTIYGEQG